MPDVIGQAIAEILKRYSNRRLTLSQAVKEIQDLFWEDDGK
jgi:hypothetical protein